MSTINRPGVGIAVLILKDNKILLGKRKGKYGDGMWSPPGGHLEFKEDILECAKRETLEETGIEITNLRIGHFTNDNNLPYEKHYITIYVLADYAKHEPHVTEPEKCYEWKWFDVNLLPSPLFYPLQNFIDAGYKSDISA